MLDSLVSTTTVPLERIADLAGVTFGGSRLRFHRADVREPASYREAVVAFGPDAVVHFAGLKSPTESLAVPASYYTVNVAGTAAIAEVAGAAGARALLFSSSATVCGDDAPVPVGEDAAVTPVTPYGHSTLMAEQVLQHMYEAGPHMGVAVLRYCNPFGAHPSGRLGEDPQGVPANLMPFVARGAGGRYEQLNVFGADFATRDGSAVRDFIHVMDLAQAHVATLE